MSCTRAIFINTLRLLYAISPPPNMRKITSLADIMQE
nr:MAG TPA: hypothetical protein [Caudoviricetes sp.]